MRWPLRACLTLMPEDASGNWISEREQRRRAFTGTSADFATYTNCVCDSWVELHLDIESRLRDPREYPEDDSDEEELDSALGEDPPKMVELPDGEWDDDPQEHRVVGASVSIVYTMGRLSTRGHKAMQPSTLLLNRLDWQVASPHY